MNTEYANKEANGGTKAKEKKDEAQLSSAKVMNCGGSNPWFLSPALLLSHWGWQANLWLDLLFLF